MICSLASILTGDRDDSRPMFETYTITIIRNGELHQKYNKDFRQEFDAQEYCENVIQSYEDRHGLLNWEVEYEKE